MGQPGERSETEGCGKEFDIWALVLLYSSIIGFHLCALLIAYNHHSIWSKVSNLERTATKSFVPHLVRYYLLCSGASLFLFVALIFCPRACIRVGLLGSCIAPLLLCYFDVATGAAIWFASIVVTSAAYFYAIRPHLDLIELILSTAASAAAGFVLRLIGIFLFLVLGALAYTRMACLCVHYLGGGWLAHVSMLFTVYHLCGAMNYFLQVLSVRTVVDCIISQQHKISFATIWKSLSAVRASLGTVCLAALLRGVVWPLKLLSFKMPEPSSHISNGRSIEYLLRAFRAVAAPLHWLCVSVVEPTNNMLLPYVATHHVCYTRALSESAALVAASKYKSFAALTAFDYALYPLEYAFAVVSFYVNSTTIGHDNSYKALWVALSTIFSTAIFHGMASAITATARGLIYAKLEYPDALGLYNSKISDALEAQINKRM
ncbi:hypothetical protein PAPHI01_1715 [Pancytospora philotis]|nr:hypothetical protein PAPHI01_1715 [Pancytospora philotis]